MTSGDKKTYAERVNLVLGLATASVAIAVAATRERPASAVAIAAVIVLCVAVGLGHVWHSRIPSGQRRFPNARIVAAAGAALLAVSAVVVIAVPSLRRVVAHDVFGFADVRRDVRIAQIVLNQAPDWYRLEVTAVNESSVEQLVRSAELAIYLREDAIASCSGTGPHYRINDLIRITPQPNGSEARIEGTVRTMPDPTEFTTAVTGELRAGCSDAVMALRFPTQLVLPAREHTQFVVDLPKQFKTPGPYPYPKDYIEPPGGGVDETAGVSLWAASVFRIVTCVADPPVPVIGQHLVPTRPPFYDDDWKSVFEKLAHC